MATIVDDDRRVELDLPPGERLTVDPDQLTSVLGWTLKPEGLCRGDVCVPVRDRSSILVDGRVDLAGVAAALGRPAVVDPVRQVAAIGRPAPAVAETMASLRAPDFSLPDLEGNLVSLADVSRRKVLLLAWSSW